MKKINPFVRWWVTPKLPPEDIFAKHNFISQWVTHPIKRRIARIYLKYLQKNTNLKVIGITGSTGKTTTTEILASILKCSNKTVWSAEGVDPVYNIPNTILKATLKTKYLILEMSVEYPNEMDFYLWLAKPDVAIITNIAKTHTQYLLNEKGILLEKGKLVKNINEGGFAVLNAEDLYLRGLKDSINSKIVYFGEGSKFSAENISLKDDMSTNFTLRINASTKFVHINALGTQFANNALAAAAAAYTLGIDIKDIVKGIEMFKNPKHRLSVYKSRKYGLIIDDTYNSNPKAVRESLDTFEVAGKGKNKIAVIGDMLELGRFEEASHRELGKKVGSMNFTRLICVGNAARYVIEEASKKMGDKKCFLVANWVEALEIVKPLINENTALFVKGSRSTHLDKLVDALN